MLNMISSHLRCRVCEKAYDGSQHCGVEVCRACAAFYKRALVLQKRYACRSGTRNCRMENTRKECCQYCRFERCRLVGLVMNVDECKSDESPCSSGTVSIEPRQTMMENLQFLTNTEVMPVLRRFANFYNKTVRNRMVFENGLRSIQETLPLDCKDKRISLLRQDTVPKIYRLNQILRKELLNEVFPVFGTFTEEYQDAVITQLMFHPWNLESAYRTVKIFQDPNCSRLMWTETMYVDTDRMLDHLGIDNGVMNIESNLLRYLRHMVESFLKSTHQYLHKIQITDLEFMAALALCFWDHSIHMHNTEASLLAEKERSRIYDDLNYYYRYEKKWDNHVERVMDLRGISKYVKENVTKMIDHMNYLKTFKYGEQDPVVFEALSRLPLPYNLN